MRYRFLLFAAALLSMNAAFAAEDAVKVRPEDIRLTEDVRDTEFCSALGEVKAKSGWGGSAGTAKGLESVKATLKKRAAAMGGNVVLVDSFDAGFTTSGSGRAYGCSQDALAKQQAKAAEIARKASLPITCTAGTDCEVRWARVMLWLQEHSTWKFRNVTDTLITTEGPLDTENKPAYEVTKVPTGDGKTYRITMRAFCGTGDCDNLILEQRASFYDALTAPLEVPAPGASSP